MSASKSLSKQFSLLATIFLLVSLAQPALAQLSPQTPPFTKNIELASGDSISAEVFGVVAASNKAEKLRVLWLASGFGFRERHQQIAERLGEQGMEIWQVDLADALFLPHSAQTLRSIPGSLVAELISTLSEQGQRPLLIVSSSYGAIPTLRGIHTWQANQPVTKAAGKPWLGAILFSPAFFNQVPTLGEAPTYISTLAATSVPLYIFQEEKNSRRWYLQDILQALQQHAPVYSEILSGTTSVFNPNDTSAKTLAALQALPGKILRASRQLRHHATPLQAISLDARTSPAKNSGLDTQLKPYRGRVQAVTFSLLDTQGNTFSLNSYAGKVTLINFWASWCTPCVKEIPSLNRLKQTMQGKPFQLISINYAEQAAQIQQFMQKVQVDFPVLLDPEGKLASQWKVVAFPSTFVIGPDAKIHAGVNAAIHWDSPAVIEQLNQLMPSP